MARSVPHNGGNPPDTPTPPSAAESPVPPESLLSGSLENIPAEHKLFQSSALGFVFLRLCIYLLFSYSLNYVLPRVVFALLRPRSFFAPKALMVGELCLAAGAYFPAWSLGLLERRHFGDYGLPRRGAFGRNFWTGAVLGLLEISVVIGAMEVFGAYRFGPIAIHGMTLLRWAVFWSAFFLVVGFVEEFQYRGYVQFTLSQGIGFWPAAVLLSLAFGVVHLANQGENWIGGAGVALTGLLWCFTLRRTGNLWLAVGMHAAFDFGETFLYSVPDSGYLFPGHLSNAIITGPRWLTGGSVGPEASVFDFVMLILFFFVIYRLYPSERAKPASESPLA